MLSILNRRPAALSSTAFMVCYVLSTVLFAVMVGALWLLLIGEFTPRQYLFLYCVVVGGVGTLTFFALFVGTGIGASVLMEVHEKRRELGVMLYPFILMLLGLALPRIFGFLY
jgi:hypothetical protein